MKAKGGGGAALTPPALVPFFFTEPPDNDEIDAAKHKLSSKIVSRPLLGISTTSNRHQGGQPKPTRIQWLVCDHEDRDRVGRSSVPRPCEARPSAFSQAPTTPLKLTSLGSTVRPSIWRKRSSDKIQHAHFSKALMLLLKLNTFGERPSACITPRRSKASAHLSASSQALRAPQTQTAAGLFFYLFLHQRLPKNFCGVAVTTSFYTWLRSQRVMGTQFVVRHKASSTTSSPDDYR